MTLFEGKIDNKYIVLQTQLELPIERRLEALGLTEGTKVALLNKKRNGAVMITVRGTRVALGKAIAKGISVVEVRTHG